MTINCFHNCVNRSHITWVGTVIDRTYITDGRRFAVMASEYTYLETSTSHDGRAAWITLDRPEKRNALSQSLLDEISTELDRIESDGTAKVVVLTGAGTAFSAGYDLTPSDGGSSNAYEDFRREKEIYDFMRRLWDFPKPTIGAINGYALAGGFELSQMLDLVIASERAEFGYPIIRGTGTPPVFFLPFVVENRLARELIFTGRHVEGEEAADVGLANRVVDHDELIEATNAMIEEVVKAPSDLLYLNKRQMNRTLDIMGYAAAIERGHDLHITGHDTDSVAEFFERRDEEGLKAALEWRNTTIKE